ncbi:hypothetical protein SADUNF_Sadunf09G0104700 [Salix dunnii]|uniref:COBRA C-terminal domain-containing protein n=1 Tax=Salix dunnii TaxID=1413687 RepID=A0A835MSM5_9ROSI|nr:hypothetical protein SADUNF_Sadunf09G0104700 [Salix dunnii]
MTVFDGNSTVYPPANLTISAPDLGYNCGLVVERICWNYVNVGFDRVSSDIEVISDSIEINMHYSTFLARKTPCCVSLLTFRDPKITCCVSLDTTHLSLWNSSEGDSLPLSDVENLDTGQCTNQMYPVIVHWHKKNNLIYHRRVKMKISNYNYKRNYSDWEVLVQHSGFRQNSTRLASTANCSLLQALQVNCLSLQSSVTRPRAWKFNAIN